MGGGRGGKRGDGLGCGLGARSGRSRVPGRRLRIRGVRRSGSRRSRLGGSVGRRR